MIDLNADLGESFGSWRMGDDAALMPLITSCNIACGFHAGDPSIMVHTLALAKAAGVRVGAHPAWPDLHGFGRHPRSATPDEVHALVLYQIGALAALCRAQGLRLHHVKPHGALYNQSADDPVMADAIAHAVADFDPALVLVGLAGSCSIEAGRQRGLVVWQEAFVDRRYDSRGRLVPRHQAGAVIASVEEAVAQAVAIARGQPLTTITGSTLQLEADTLCLHGDSPYALAVARQVRAGLNN